MPFPHIAFVFPSFEITERLAGEYEPFSRVNPLLRSEMRLFEVRLFEVVPLPLVELNQPAFVVEFVPVSFTPLQFVFLLSKRPSSQSVRDEFSEVVVLSFETVSMRFLLLEVLAIPSSFTVEFFCVIGRSTMPKKYFDAVSTDRISTAFTW